MRHQGERPDPDTKICFRALMKLNAQCTEIKPAKGSSTTCTIHPAGSARRCPRVWCHRCQAASLSLRATTGQWMWHQCARPSPAPAAQFAAWLHSGSVLPVALSLTPAACRATCLATTVKQEGKTTALLALSYSLTQPWQWGRAPRSPLLVRP